MVTWWCTTCTATKLGDDKFSIPFLFGNAFELGLFRFGLRSARGVGGGDLVGKGRANVLASIVARLFGTDVDDVRVAARLEVQLGADGERGALERVRVAPELEAIVDGRMKIRRTFVIQSERKRAGGVVLGDLGGELGNRDGVGQRGLGLLIRRGEVTSARHVVAVRNDFLLLDASNKNSLRQVVRVDVNHESDVAMVFFCIGVLKRVVSNLCNDAAHNESVAHAERGRVDRRRRARRLKRR